MKARTITDPERDRANGARLRILRGDKTQAKAAADLGLSVMTLSQYELGKRRPIDEIKIRIARYYGSTVHDIFFADE